MRVAKCDVCKLYTRNYAYVLCDGERTVGLQYGELICMRCAYRYDVPISQDNPLDDGDDYLTRDEVREIEERAIRRYQERAERFQSLLATGRERFNQGKVPFRAKYPGICKNCGERVEIGQMVRFMSRVGLWHDNCEQSGSTYIDTRRPEQEVVLTSRRKFRLVK